MTLVLVAANLAVAFFAPFSPMMANFAFDPFKPNLLSALTCLFLHDPSNILHLLGNMVFLAAVGPLVESSLGPTKFLVVYLVGGLAGDGLLARLALLVRRVQTLGNLFEGVPCKDPC